MSSAISFFRLRGVGRHLIPDSKHNSRSFLPSTGEEGRNGKRQIFLKKEVHTVQSRDAEKTVFLIFFLKIATKIPEIDSVAVESVRETVSHQ